ncbi:hypothetical protein NDU88_000675 [Pleurodeles waltl]|uniref:Uncharacterized protein n=1 Tax=Pleurodeles waltl TaxID=8319 RepID=A0AAV7L7M0_PLEWA|nr:hypothetical protein NDU88_000675 [Pleurodeles waltl]
MSQSEESVLKKGLQFCPSTDLELVQTRIDFYKYIRKIKLAKTFAEAKMKEKTDPLLYEHDLTVGDKDTLMTLVNLDLGDKPVEASDIVKPLGAGLTDKRPPSKFYPVLPAGNKIDLFAEMVIHDLYKKNWNKKVENLTIPEKQALHRLQMDTLVEIKPADKDGNIVIQNKQDYVKEAMRQLLDKTCYAHAIGNPLLKSKEEINLCIVRWENLGLIDQVEAKY